MGFSNANPDINVLQETNEQIRDLSKAEYQDGFLERLIEKIKKKYREKKFHRESK
ncbi:MAG: hypothetical protein IKY02_02065 [Lachnospiraceae bacterium]|nr:hypothetical protein [Lachnospiraceae bacterium]MBR5738756.1 hypothetical protein [Lachnospiraceae bacterium]